MSNVYYKNAFYIDYYGLFFVDSQEKLVSVIKYFKDIHPGVDVYDLKQAIFDTFPYFKIASDHRLPITLSEFFEQHSMTKV